MTPEEMDEIINAIPKLNIEKMKMQDQLQFASIYVAFAEQMKPFIAKYVDAVPGKQTFLFKM